MDINSVATAWYVPFAYFISFRSFLFFSLFSCSWRARISRINWRYLKLVALPAGPRGRERRRGLLLGRHVSPLLPLRARGEADHERGQRLREGFVARHAVLPACGRELKARCVLYTSTVHFKSNRLSFTIGFCLRHNNSLNVRSDYCCASSKSAVCSALSRRRRRRGLSRLELARGAAGARGPERVRERERRPRGLAAALPAARRAHAARVGAALAGRRAARPLLPPHAALPAPRARPTPLAPGACTTRLLLLVPLFICCALRPRRRGCLCLRCSPASTLCLLVSVPLRVAPSWPPVPGAAARYRRFYTHHRQRRKTVARVAGVHCSLLSLSLHINLFTIAYKFCMYEYSIQCTLYSNSCYGYNFNAARAYGYNFNAVGLACAQFRKSWGGAHRLLALVSIGLMLVNVRTGLRTAFSSCRLSVTCRCNARTYIQLRECM